MSERPKYFYKVSVDPKLVFNPTEKYSTTIMNILRIFSKHGMFVKMCDKTDIIETPPLDIEFSRLTPLLDELTSRYPALESKPIAFTLTVEEHWKPVARKFKVTFNLNQIEEETNNA